MGPELLYSLTHEYRVTGPPWLIFHTANAAELVKTIESLSGRDVLRIPYGDLAERTEVLEKAMSAPGQVAVLEPDASEMVEPGRPSELSGSLSFRALKAACDWIEAHPCLGLVTGPLSKEHVSLSGHLDFTGHTGYLARRFRSRVVMLMHGRSFSVLPLTVHIPLREVSSQLGLAVEDPALTAQIQAIMNRPAYRGQRVALCGLNPHSGEGGLLGTEEKDYLDQFAMRLREKGLDVDGPLSADGLFTEGVRKNYRLILSCYHDQGLIPFKALEGMNGVNATIGLPFLRTSPDHGTAFSLAGKGIAKPDSLLQAYRTIVQGEL